MKTIVDKFTSPEYITSKILNSDKPFECDINENGEIILTLKTLNTIKEIAELCDLTFETAKEFVLKCLIDLPIFSYYTKPIMNVKPRSNINLLQLYEVIRNPKYFEKATLELRKIPDKTAKAKFKQTQFDFALLHGIFEPNKRTSKDCIKPSGYLCIDIDHYKGNLSELKKTLIGDYNLDIQLMFISPSGDGLKVVIQYDTNKNTLIEIFEFMELYFKQAYQITIDDKCKNIDRACFICYDSEVFINPKILNI